MTKEDKMIELLKVREQEGGPHYRMFDGAWERWSDQRQEWMLIENKSGGPITTRDLFERARAELGLCDEAWREAASRIL